MSNACMNISGTYITAEEFKKNYKALDDIEQTSLLAHIIINNTPYIFKEIPLLYEQIKQYLSDRLQIQNESIKIIGSAKTGFSVSPLPYYGKKFSEKSDLDFTIISETLFEKLNKEYLIWETCYNNKQVLPQNDIEEKYWINNISLLKRTTSRGFIDTNKIPNREICPLTMIINNSMYLIKYKLKEYHNIIISKASVRVYKNYNLFLKQLKLNTDQIVSIQ